MLMCHHGRGMGGACLASCWCCPVCSPWGHLARMLLFLTCTHSLCMWCACRAPARPPALQPLNGTPASPYTQQASPSSPHGPQDYDLQPTARMATQQQQQQLSTGGGSSSGGHPFSSAGSPPPPQLGRGDSLDRFRQDASPLLHGQGQGQGQGSPTGPGPVPAYLTPGGPPGQQHSGTASPYAYGDSSSGGAGAGVGRPPSSASPGGIVPIMYAPGAQVQYTPGYQQHYKLAQAEQQQQQQQWGGSGAQAEQQLQQQQQQWGQSGCSRVVTASPPQTAGSSGKYEFSTPWGLDVQQQQQQRGPRATAPATPSTAPPPPGASTRTWLPCTSRRTCRAAGHTTAASSPSRSHSTACLLRKLMRGAGCPIVWSGRRYLAGLLGG